MDEKERLTRGMKLRAARCSAMPGSTAPTPDRNAFNAEWQDFITRYALGRNLDAAAFRRAHAPHPGDRHHDRARPLGGVQAARARRAHRRRLLRRRHQGDHPAAGDLLRRAGRQSRLQGRRRGAQGRRQAVLTAFSRALLNRLPTCDLSSAGAAEAQPWPKVRKGMPDVRLTREEFARRYPPAICRSGVRAAQ